MMFLVAQILGVIVTITSVVIVQFKNIRHILIGEVISNLLVAINFALLGGMSGAGVCVTATIQTVIAYFYTKNDRNFPKPLTALFCTMYIICSIMTYKDGFDIISCTAALLFAVAVIQKDASKYRVLMIVNSVLWIIYDVGTEAYTTVLTHAFLTISILAAIIRLDLKKRIKKP